MQPEEVIRDLRARDAARPQSRRLATETGADAVLLDSTNMTLEEAVQEAEAIVASRLSLPVEQQ